MYIYIEREGQRETYQYLHKIEYYSAIKKNKILPFVTTWMDPEGIMLSEINETGKDKHLMISTTGRI